MWEICIVSPKGKELVWTNALTDETCFYQNYFSAVMEIGFIRHTVPPGFLIKIQPASVSNNPLYN